MPTAIYKKSTHPTTRANRCNLCGLGARCVHQACGEFEATARKTGPSGMWVGGQKQLDATAHQWGTAADDLAQGGCDHLGPLCCGFSSWLALIGSGLGQFWPNPLPIIWPQLLASHYAFGCDLNRSAVLYRYRATCPPVRHGTLDNTNGGGQLANTIGGGYCVVKSIHAAILITFVIIWQHLCD